MRVVTNMKFVIIVSLSLVATSLLVASEEQQQRVSRRVVAKSNPFSDSFVGFGKRSVNEQTSNQTPSSSVTANPTATSTTPKTETASASSGSATEQSANKVIATANNNRQQRAAAQSGPETELLSSAPSSWQMLSTIEAPSINPSSDLSASSSDDESSLLIQNDFLRSSSSGTKGVYTSGAGVEETFSRLRQASKSKPQQQTSFFHPSKQKATTQGKTSNYQSSKTNWYQQASNPRPAPIVQEQQQYEQQNEQYTEQQQVESAPPGQAEPFAFDFNTQDDSGNGQYRKEESDNNGVVRGSYGFRDASGIYRHVEYVADQNGFRANIKTNEPGIEAGPKSQPASIRLDGGGLAR